MTITERPQKLMFELQHSRVRFAPSPNGYLHLGHAYSALLNWHTAQNLEGTFLLRIENIDINRSKPEFETAIYDDLRWLGLTWPEPVMRQSTRFDHYAQALQKLIAQGLLYPAFLSRKQIREKIAAFESSGQTWPRDPEGAPVYPGDCRLLSQKERQARIARGDRFNWRLDMSKALKRLNQKISWQEYGDNFNAHIITPDPALWGDVIIARADILTSYHLSVVLDDAIQNINLIIRGADLYQTTSVHRLLQILLGLPEPKYYHHKLILSKDRRKLSKKNKDTSIKELREKRGLKTNDIKRLIGCSSLDSAFQ